MSWLLAAPLILPFVTAVIAFFVKDGTAGRWCSVLGSLLTLFATIALMMTVRRSATC